VIDTGTVGGAGFSSKLPITRYVTHSEQEEVVGVCQQLCTDRVYFLFSTRDAAAIHNIQHGTWTETSSY
jgi:hypothetical protein